MPKPLNKPTTAQALDNACVTHTEKAKEYGDSIDIVGDVLGAMFPDGLDLNTAGDFSRFSKFNWIVCKLCRYAQNMRRGGHKDSAHDIIVYAAMLESVTNDD